MANIPELVSKLATGDGVYKGDAVFALADGSFVDADKNAVAPASAIGAAAYAAHPGYMPANTVIPYQMLGFMSEVDSVINGLPTIYVDGDFWVKQKTGADELYVAASSAWVLSEATFTEAATASAPESPVDGDYWYDTTVSKLYAYVTDAWVEVTEQQYVRAASAPAFYADGYIIADQSTKKIYTKSTTWGSGVSLASGKLYTDGTDIYVFGSGSLAKI